MKGKKILKPFEVFGKKVVAFPLDPCGYCIFNSPTGCKRPDDVYSCFSIERTDKRTVRYIEYDYAVPNKQDIE